MNGRQAIKATFSRRATGIPQGVPSALTDFFSADTEKQKQWQSFLQKNRLEAPTLEKVVSELGGFLLPPLQALSGESRFQNFWVFEHGWHLRNS